MNGKLPARIAYLMAVAGVVPLAYFLLFDYLLFSHRLSHHQMTLFGFFGLVIGSAWFGALVLLRKRSMQSP